MNLTGKHLLEIKCTYAQLMAIGELKRKMIGKVEAEPIAEGKLHCPSYKPYEIHIDTTSIERAENNIGKNKRRNKSKQAYDILKGLDYEYDLVKQQWYKKQYI